MWMSLAPCLMASKIRKLTRRMTGLSPEAFARSVTSSFSSSTISSSSWPMSLMISSNFSPSLSGGVAGLDGGVDVGLAHDGHADGLAGDAAA